jgi:hypothetical protein
MDNITTFLYLSMQVLYSHISYLLAPWRRHLWHLRQKTRNNIAH